MLAPVSWVPRQCKECFSHSGFSFCRQKSPWRTCRAPQPCQPEHRATAIRLHAVKAHFSNLITHGLLGLTFPQCTGDRHPSVSPLSQAQISWQRQEKLNNLFTAKHSEAKRQRHWQTAVMFWQRSTRSHVQVNFCCEQKPVMVRGSQKKSLANEPSVVTCLKKQIFSAIVWVSACKIKRFKLPDWDATWITI